MLNFKVEKQLLHRMDNTINVSESQEYLVASFTFSEEWNDLNKYIIYSNDWNEHYELIYSEINVVPWEVLLGGYFTVSIYGVSSENPSFRITTNEEKVLLTATGYTKDVSSTVEPSKDVFFDIYDKLKTKYDNVLKDGNYLVFYSNGVEKKRIGVGGIDEETDPIFTASAAYDIEESDISNWDNKIDEEDVEDDMQDFADDLARFIRLI